MKRSQPMGVVVLFASCLWALSAAAFGSEKDPFDMRAAELDAAGAKGLTLLPYYATYILPASYQSNPNNENFARHNDGYDQKHLEIKYQISFRFPMWLNIADRGINLYAAYTQQSFWQAYNESASSVFRDTTYEPEVMLAIPWKFSVGPLTNRHVIFGFVHQSNGQSGDLDRSWNRLYARVVQTIGPVVLAVRAWVKTPQGTSADNSDISDYYGYGDLMARIHLRRHTFSVMCRNNLHLSDNRGAVELGWTYPFVYGLRWYVQYWNGYGESLVDYNYASHRIGAGILLGEWL